jgi:hypothetical protein
MTDMLEKLKIIASDQIISFERYNPERAGKLAQEIKRDGKLRNPLLVYPLDNKFLLLDDVSILQVLDQLGAFHVPVQLAEVATLSVHPWQRIVENWHHADLMEFCAKLPRQVRVDRGVSDSLAANQVEVRFRDKSVKKLTFLSKSYLVRADICARFFNHLAANHKSYRAKLDYSIREPLKGFKDSSAAIFPPTFSLSELAAMAKRGIHLPQGVVRIDQPNRVLGIDYLLSILAEKAPAIEKEIFLRQLLEMRMSSDRVAYYNSGVFMFNN